MITMLKKSQGKHVSITQVCGSIIFYPANPDFMDTDPPENTLEFKMSKRDIYQQCFY